MAIVIVYYCNILYSNKYCNIIIIIVTITILIISSSLICLLQNSNRLLARGLRDVDAARAGRLRGPPLELPVHLL